MKLRKFNNFYMSDGGISYEKVGIMLTKLSKGKWYAIEEITSREIMHDIMPALEFFEYADHIKLRGEEMMILRKSSL